MYFTSTTQVHQYFIIIVLQIRLINNTRLNIESRANIVHRHYALRSTKCTSTVVCDFDVHKKKKHQGGQKSIEAEEEKSTLGARKYRGKYGCAVRRLSVEFT